VRSSATRRELLGANGRKRVIFGLQRQGRDMSVDFKDGHPAMDYREHERTYAGFIRGTIVLSVIVAIILIGMALFLVP
jgi:hypothetical protein